MCPSLIVPNGVAEQIMAEKAGQDEARRFLHVRERLRAVDPRLDLFLCERDDPENELRQGFYYVWRRGDGGIAGFWEIANADGSYREPDERVVEAFQLMGRESLQDFRDQRDRKRRQARREVERKREEAAGEFRELADFTFRTQMPFSVDTSHWKKD